MQTKYMDPFHVWKSFYTEIEPKMSQTMQTWLESDEYAAVSGQLMNATLQMEQNFIKTVEQLFQAYNVPTLKDFARLGELVVGLESKVDNLDERLYALETTLRDSVGIRDELNDIAVQLEAIQQSLPQNELKNDSAPKSTRRRVQKNEQNSEDVGSENV